jgi:hypothetical protein
MKFGIEVKIASGVHQRDVRLDVTLIHPGPSHSDEHPREDRWRDIVDADHTHYIGCIVDDTDRSGTYRFVVGYRGLTVIDQSFDVELHCTVPIS